MSWVVGIVPDNFWKENESRIFSVQDAEGFLISKGSYTPRLVAAKRFKTHNLAYKETLEEKSKRLMTLEISEDD